MATKTQLRVTQTRSYIGHPRTTRAVLKGLGLGRIGKQVTVENTPSFRGAIKKVIHLVSVEELAGDKATVVVEG